MSIRHCLAFPLLIASAGCSHETRPSASPSSASSVSASPAPPAEASQKEFAAPPGEVRVPAYVRAAVDAADRSTADRALDAGRRPDLTLAFFGIRPGMRVAEIGAGLGYTSELLSRVVGPTGKVYAQNSPMILEKFANGPWTERLTKPALANVVRADRQFDDPFPAEAKDLDAVLNVLFYHDTVWIGVDRQKMNRAVFAALKSGGVYGIVDHSGLPGSGLTGAKTVHRIEEKTLRDEIEQAGFRLVAEGSFLRNPSDTRDWNDSPKEAGERRGTSDRFVLKFEKP
jgi:predicted methyltransferase